jgi:transposase
MLLANDRPHLFRRGRRGDSRGVWGLRHVSISERKDVSKGADPARRLEIFTEAGRRRAWTTEQKAAIVAESFEDGALVSHVARRHGLTPQQLFAGRRQARREAEEAIGGLPFAPVVVAASRAAASREGSAERKSADTRPPVIEVHVEGSSVWIWSGAEVAMVTAIIGALQGCEVISPSGVVRVLVATRLVDFRKGANGLALVRNVMQADPFDGAIYVFRAERAQLPTFCI